MTRVLPKVLSAAIIAAVLVVGAGCSSPTPTPAPTPAVSADRTTDARTTISTPTSTSTSTPTPTSTSVVATESMALPGTPCGTVTYPQTGTSVEVSVHTGSITCTTAMAVASKYVGDATVTHTGGNTWPAEFDGWFCSTATSALSEERGYSLGCVNDQIGGEIRGTDSAPDVQNDVCGTYPWSESGQFADVVVTRGSLTCEDAMAIARDMKAMQLGDMTDALDPSSPLAGYDCGGVSRASSPGDVIMTCSVAAGTMELRRA